MFADPTAKKTGPKGCLEVLEKLIQAGTTNKNEFVNLEKKDKPWWKFSS